MPPDHQPSEAVAAAAAFPPKQIADSLAFMEEILAELEAAPDVQYQFFELLSGPAKRGGDEDAVESRAAELLRGHPDVLRRVTAWVHTPLAADEVHAPAAEEARPRRRSRTRSERRDAQQQTPAAEAPPNVAAATRNRCGDGDGLRLVDPSALAFVKRVHGTAGPVVHARFLAVLCEAERSEDMFADEVYDRAKTAFGPAHVGLLHAFATAWLPGEAEWKLQQQQQARGRGPAASSHAAAGMLPDARKKPRADDGGKNGRRRHDHVIAVLKVRNVKKRRLDDDGTTGRGRRAVLRVGESESSGGRARAAPPQGRDDDYDYDYAPRSRAKKPHSGNGEFSGSAAAAQALGADATGGVHRAYSGDKRKPPRRQAASGGKGSSAAAGPEQQPQQERDEEVRRFRQEWEFQTCYSKLVATSDRVKELLLLRPPPRRRHIPHGDGGGGGGDRSLEELFPLPECREFLHSCYGDLWGEMSAALERGESRVPALEAIERSLTAKEEEAVVEESRKRCRHDPARVAQRLHGLAMDTVNKE